MDEHVPRAITLGLRLRGVDVLTTQEDGRSGEADPELLSRATALGRVFFSQDQDLLVEAALRQTRGVAFSGVVFAPAQRLSVGKCVGDRELLATAHETEDLEGVVVYLPL